MLKILLNVNNNNKQFDSVNYKLEMKLSRLVNKIIKFIS